MVIDPVKSWLAWTVPFVSLSLNCSSVPWQPWDLSNSLSSSRKKRSQSSPLMDLTITSLPHPSLKPSSLSFSQNQHAHLPAGLIQSLALSFFCLGSSKSQPHSWFFTPSLHQSSPNPQPMSHSTSHHVIPGHYYTLLTDVTSIIFADINWGSPSVPLFPSWLSHIQSRLWGVHPLLQARLSELNKTIKFSLKFKSQRSGFRTGAQTEKSSLFIPFFPVRWVVPVPGIGEGRCGETGGFLRRKLAPFSHTGWALDRFERHFRAEGTSLICQEGAQHSPGAEE